MGFNIFVSSKGLKFQKSNKLLKIFCQNSDICSNVILELNSHFGVLIYALNTKRVVFACNMPYIYTKIPIAAPFKKEKLRLVLKVMFDFHSTSDVHIKFSILRHRYEYFKDSFCTKNRLIFTR